MNSYPRKKLGYMSASQKAEEYSQINRNWELDFVALIITIYPAALNATGNFI
jgi:hypothetical protein